MKYFTYELTAAANGWIDQTEEARLNADRQLEEAAKQYHSSLAELKSRISSQAWDFFESGHGRDGLHDGRLISLSIGDSLEYLPDGAKPFRINHQRTAARVVFLNYEQDLLYTFDLRGVSRMSSELFMSQFSVGLGDLFTYEIVAINESLLQLGFLFASGASIIGGFTKLGFHRQRIKRKYSLDDICRLRAHLKK